MHVIARNCDELLRAVLVQVREMAFDVLSSICASRDLYSHFVSFLSLAEKTKVTMLTKTTAASVSHYRRDFFIARPMLSSKSTELDEDGLDESYLYVVKYLFATRLPVDSKRVRILLRNDEAWTYAFLVFSI